MFSSRPRLFRARDYLDYLRRRIKAQDIDYLTALQLIKRASDELVLDKVRPTHLVKATQALEPNSDQWLEVDKMASKTLKSLNRRLKGK